MDFFGEVLSKFSDCPVSTNAPYASTLHNVFSVFYPYISSLSPCLNLHLSDERQVFLMVYGVLVEIIIITIIIQKIAKSVHNRET